MLEGTHEEGEDSSFQTLMFQNFKVEAHMIPGMARGETRRSR